MIEGTIHTDHGTFRHQAFGELSSTNEKCLELGQSGDAGNLWVTASCQSRGRGSRGRSWTSEPGNLYASLLLVDACEPRNLVELTFVAAVSVQQAIGSVCVGQEIPQVKWPNDVLLNGKKCSGILLESSVFRKRTIIAVGIGINCVSYPKDALFPATCLKSEGIEVSVEQVFENLAAAFAENFRLWSSGRNFSAIREAWLGHARGLGKKIVVNIPGQPEISGTFATIDESGYMLLKLANGETRKISAADVFFMQAGS